MEPWSIELHGDYVPLDIQSMVGVMQRKEKDEHISVVCDGLQIKISSVLSQWKGLTLERLRSLSSNGGLNYGLVV